MKNMFAILSIAAVATGIAGAADAEYPHISIQELQRAIKTKEVVVVDANPATVYREYHIPGAVHYTAVKPDLVRVLPPEKDALVVTYCAGPDCNAYQPAAAAIRELGYTNVKYLPVGIAGWREAGLPTEEEIEAAEEAAEDAADAREEAVEEALDD